MSYYDKYLKYKKKYLELQELLGGSNKKNQTPEDKIKIARETYKNDISKLENEIRNINVSLRAVRVTENQKKSGRERISILEQAIAQIKAEAKGNLIPELKAEAKGNLIPELKADVKLENNNSSSPRSPIFDKFEGKYFDINSFDINNEACLFNLINSLPGFKYTPEDEDDETVLMDDCGENGFYRESLVADIIYKKFLLKDYTIKEDKKILLDNALTYCGVYEGKEMTTLMLSCTRGFYGVCKRLMASHIICDHEFAGTEIYNKNETLTPLMCVLLYAPKNKEILAKLISLGTNFKDMAGETLIRISNEERVALYEAKKKNIGGGAAAADIENDHYSFITNEFERNKISFYLNKRDVFVPVFYRSFELRLFVSPDINTNKMYENIKNQDHDERLCCNDKLKINYNKISDHYPRNITIDGLNITTFNIRSTVMGMNGTEMLGLFELYGDKWISSGLPLKCHEERMLMLGNYLKNYILKFNIDVCALQEIDRRTIINWLSNRELATFFNDYLIVFSDQRLYNTFKDEVEIISIETINFPNCGDYKDGINYFDRFSDVAGGCALIIRKNLRFRSNTYEINFKKSLAVNNRFYGVHVDLISKDNAKLSFCSVHLNKPSRFNNKFNDQLTHLKSNVKNYTFVCGDFNNNNEHKYIEKYRVPGQIIHMFDCNARVPAEIDIRTYDESAVRGGASIDHIFLVDYVEVSGK